MHIVYEVHYLSFAREVNASLTSTLIIPEHEPPTGDPDFGQRLHRLLLWHAEEREREGDPDRTEESSRLNLVPNNQQARCPITTTQVQ